MRSDAGFPTVRGFNGAVTPGFHEGRSSQGIGRPTKSMRLCDAVRVTILCAFNVLVTTGPPNTDSARRCESSPMGL